MECHEGVGGGVMRNTCKYHCGRDTGNNTSLIALANSLGALPSAHPSSFFNNTHTRVITDPHHHHF